MNVHNWNGGIILNIDINTVTTPFLNEAAEKETFEEKSLWPFGLFPCMIKENQI